MDRFEVEPIGRVESERTHLADDFWGGQECRIVLSDRFDADALRGIEEFSHVEVIFLFDQVDPSEVVWGDRHPRHNRDWPAVGIFAQRAKFRPNRIGSTICRVLKSEDVRLYVSELDAVDGTPVLDIKPVLTDFLPREVVRQPPWSQEIMSKYWKPKD